MTKPTKLDMEISQEVLGHIVSYEKNGSMREQVPGGQSRPLRLYSQDIAASWEVVEKLGITLIPVEQGWFAFVGQEKGWKSPADFLTFLQKADFAKAGAAVGDTAPMTICIAAINAIEHRKNHVDVPVGELNHTIIQGDLPVPIFQN